MKSVFCILLCFIVFISFIFSLPKGRCETQSSSYLYVGGTAVGNYSRIQDAVDHALKDSIVFVYSGLYNEHLTIDIPLQLIGEDKHTTIINGDGTDSVIILTSDRVIIQGFTIQNSSKSFPKAGIYVTSQYNTITENIISNNFYGIVLMSSSYNIITKNRIVDNGQCGIYFSEATSNILIQNTVENHPFNGFGLYDFSDSNTILGNTLARNQFHGVNIRDSYDNSISGNTFHQNHIGIHIPPPLFRTSVDDNTFIGNDITVDEEKDFIPLSWIVYGLLSILGFIVIKRRFLIF